MRNVLSWLKGRVAHAPMKPRHQVTHEEARKQAAATLWRTDHPDPAAALADDVFAGKPGGLSLSRKLSKQQKEALRKQLWDREDEENRQANPNMSQEHSDREGPPEHPMPAPPGSPLIYVDNLEASMDNEALYDTFRLFGGVLTCKVACDEDGKSKRSGVVHFESADSAQEASERVGGMQIGERAVVVKQLSNAEATEYLQGPSLKAHLTLRGENLR